LIDCDGQTNTAATEVFQRLSKSFVSTSPWTSELSWKQVPDKIRYAKI